MPLNNEVCNPDRLTHCPVSLLVFVDGLDVTLMALVACWPGQVCSWWQQTCYIVLYHPGRHNTLLSTLSAHAIPKT